MPIGLDRRARAYVSHCVQLILLRYQAPCVLCGGSTTQSQLRPTSAAQPLKKKVKRGADKHRLKVSSLSAILPKTRRWCVVQGGTAPACFSSRRTESATLHTLSADVTAMMFFAPLTAAHAPGPRSCPSKGIAQTNPPLLQQNSTHVRTTIARAHLCRRTQPAASNLRPADLLNTRRPLPNYCHPA
jgi:hypothetical protein